ncbi:MAG: Flp pilus assembly protein CpaB [Candidatus Omnitrophica bacterium]|nr:Flp pilus assembly protein CpaB [Candidatus Omnitrophota bacterium]
MLFDFKKIDRKKLIVVVVAIAAAIGAVVLTNAYINRSVEQGASSKQVQFLMEKVTALEGAANEAKQQQAALVNQVQQEFNNLAQQQPKAAQAVAAVLPKPQSLALKTPQGKRAITVNITTLSAVGGLLNPGDFVDILVHLAIPDPNGSVQIQGKDSQPVIARTTVTLFQNIQILAIGANVDTPADFDGQQKTATLAITFAVDPQQAELIAFAESYGNLQLVLRGSGEKAAYKLPSGNWESLISYIQSTQGVVLESPVPAKKAVSKKEVQPEIFVYRGGTK